jgi:hypothetical protein
MGLLFRASSPTAPFLLSAACFFLAAALASGVRKRRAFLFENQRNDTSQLSGCKPTIFFCQDRLGTTTRNSETKVARSFSQSDGLEVTTVKQEVAAAAAVVAGRRWGSTED